MLTIIEKILYHNDCITAKTTMNIISINSNVDKIVIIDITNMCQLSILLIYKLGQNGIILSKSTSPSLPTIRILQTL